jgi:hypothetical protein
MTDLTNFDDASGRNSGDSAESEQEKSDIIELQGEGDRFEKSLRDRATGINRSGDDTEIEAL